MNRSKMYRTTVSMPDNLYDLVFQYYRDVEAESIAQAIRKLIELGLKVNGGRSKMEDLREEIKDEMLKRIKDAHSDDVQRAVLRFAILFLL